MNLFVFLITLLVFSSCKQNTSDPQSTEHVDSLQEPPSVNEYIEKESTEATYLEDGQTDIKTVTNTRFDFYFEIPSTWKAIDKSNNGDGYFLDSGNKSVDLRIYGEALEGNEMMAEMELQSCTKTEKFIFRNGYPGIKCFQKGDEYYYYDTPLTRIVFYIHADAAWIKQNATLLTEIAKSLTSGQTNFN